MSLADTSRFTRRPEVWGAGLMVRGPGCVAVRPSLIWIGLSNPWIVVRGPREA